MTTEVDVMGIDEEIIRIAVCDDEDIMRKQLTDMIVQILSEKEISYELEDFSSGIQLLEEIAKFQLVFLDIEMPQLDGIEVGTWIRQKNPRCQIVIASGMEERFKETYKIKATRFVSKPYNCEEIEEALQTYFDEYCLGMATLEVYCNRNEYWIRQKDVQYISAYNSTVNVHSNEKTYRKDISLNKVEELLEKRLFFRVHKAYIVNLKYVTDYNDKEVLIGNVRLPLSRRQKKEFERAYMQFDIAHN